MGELVYQISNPVYGWDSYGQVQGSSSVFALFAARDLQTFSDSLISLITLSDKQTWKDTALSFWVYLDVDPD